MSLRAERIPPHELKLAQMLDRQIKALETGSDPKSVFDKGQLRELETLGSEEYLAYLKTTRQRLGQPDGLSEE